MTTKTIHKSNDDVYTSIQIHRAM